MTVLTSKLANKFLGLGILLAAAVAVPVVPLVNGYGEQISVAEKERVGVAIHRELRTILQGLQRHRGTSTALLSGKMEFKERADQARADVDAAVQKADGVVAASEGEIGKLAVWPDFKNAWQRLRADFGGLKPDKNARQHTELIAVLMDAMDQAADLSGLVLDPEAETYYAMDLALLQMTPATERMGQIRALGSLVLYKQSIDQVQRDALVAGFAEIGLRERTVKTDGGKIFAVNPAARDRLGRSFELVESQLAIFANNVERNILRADSLTYQPERFFDETTQAIDASFALYDEVVHFLDDSLSKRSERLRHDRGLVLLMVSAMIALAAGIAFVILRQVNRSVVVAANALGQIAAGRFDVPLAANSNDEIGNLIVHLDDMQKQLRERSEKERRLANETLRIKVALDVSSNNVMVADPDGLIIYCNASLLDMMGKAEADIRHELPHFRAAGILGSNFDAFHKKPGHQRHLLASLTGIHRAQIVVGGRTFTLVASPIVNDGAERLGSVIEWADRTAEVAIEREVAEIIDAAAGGDFSHRIDAARMTGFFKQISDGINRLLDVNCRVLDDLGAMLTRLSKGDLTRKIDTEYQGMLGQLKNDANATVDHLQKIIFSIKGATDAINIAAQEIAGGNQDLSSRTEQQASSLEETASSMEELTGTVKQNSDSARQANELASAAQRVAERGGQVVGQVVETMAAIHTASRRISDIISVIDGIAFQTNILALNAAVEAARAGEQGRGFAVVATEVRNLAQRSAAAAKEIKGLISDSVDKVGAGSNLVDQAGSTMSEVVVSIQRVAKIMADISSASREQTTGIEQVAQAVSQMDQMTQQNAALVEQAAAAAESLEEQARSLALSVSVFRLAGGVTIVDQRRLEGLDFDGAIAAHGKWKKRLLDYVAGGGEQLDPAVVGRDDQCALGCWIHGEGRVMRGDGQYSDLKTEHAGFHRCAAEVIRTHLAGNTAGAREQIVGEFSGRSRKVIALLEHMRSGNKAAAEPLLPAAKQSLGRKQLALAAPVDNGRAEF